MPQLEPVDPLTLDEIVDLFEPAPFPWWIAGGWGIDLFLGTQTRPHEDLDVVVLRRHQHRLQEILKTWDLHVVDPPGTRTLRPWAWGEKLVLPVHEIWCRLAPELPWKLEVLLGETDDHDWVYRREPSVTRSLQSLGLRTPEGIPYIAPEVLLLFKAKHPRPSDQQDFDLVVDQLGSRAKVWLREALAKAHPGHLWITRL